MLRKLKNKSAQTSFVEYTLVILMVASVMGLMGTYYKRSVQARIRDARLRQYDFVKNQVGNLYQGCAFYRTYEPYYLKSNTIVDVDSKTTLRELPVTGGAQQGVTTGIFQTEPDVKARRRRESQTLSPYFAN